MKRPGETAEELLGAMIAAEPVAPMAWAVIKNDAGEIMYCIAYALGKNAPAMVKVLHELRESGKLVDVPANFDELGVKPPADQPPD